MTLSPGKQCSTRNILSWTIALVITMLTGCALQAPLVPGPESRGMALGGTVYGGQQAVTGSKIYLYAASTSGYSAAAVSLLNGVGYVTTDSSGNFSITGDYTCPAGGYVYLLALGGNPGLAAGTNNAKLGLMAGLGPCSALTHSTFIVINEVTTVATAYALAQFTASEVQVGTSSTNVLGLQHAFATIPNLVNIATGAAQATTLAGNGTVPQAEINSLANSLAACVNSDGTGSPCTSLMTAAGVTGAGGAPIDTIQAAINIAKNPAVNPSTIYSLGTAAPPFQPALASAPADWTLAIAYTGGINQSQGLAIDASGNIWLSHLFGENVTEYSPSGALLSPLTGYTAPTLYGPQQIAIDLSGNVWVTSQKHTVNGVVVSAASIIEFSSNGTVLSGATGFTGGGYTGALAILADPSGNIWTCSASTFSLNKFSNAGVAISPSTGYTGGGITGPCGYLAMDTNLNVWAITFTPNTPGVLAKFSSLGTALSPSTGYTGGGLYTTQGGIAIDHLNNIWVGDFYTLGTTAGGALSEFTNSGTPVSGSNGFTAGVNFPDWTIVDGLGHIWSGNGSTTGSNASVSELASDGTPLSGAIGYTVLNGGFRGGIDQAGNIWMSGISTLSEIVGIAAPLTNPLVKQVQTNTLGTRP